MTLSAADDVFVEHRTALFGLAYRMLGSVSDAEDVVSDAYLRWQRALDGDAAVDDPRAYLMTATARLSLDELKTARRRRVDYVGTWLPEPLVTTWDDPGDDVAAAETLSLGFLLLLERLTPVERAVFVLREAFDYPYADIARMLDVKEPTARQHHRRARERLGPDARARFRAEPAKRDELVQRFVAATTTGEVQPLVELLATDAVLYGDGGGKAPTIPRPAHGALRIARFIRGLVRHAPPGMSVDLVRANGEPAILLRDGDEVLGLYEFEVDETASAVRGIHAVRNPDKLRNLP